MMVKDVTKVHKCHWGGWGILECVCGCARFHTGFLVLGGKGWGGEVKIN